MKEKHFTKWAMSVFLIAFIFLSVVLMFPYDNPEEPQVRAKALRLEKVINENVERTDYVDKNGKITVAADVGYATMVTIKREKSRLEHFYDEKGEPIRRYSGYYGILREYDDEQRNFHIQYLGIDDLPVITGYGYSDKYLTFYDTGKKKTEKYYDPSGNPVCTKLYGHGLLNEYDENGKLIRITYLNEQDEPMLVGLGYAIVYRNYYKTEGLNKGKVESEFYFDEDGKPIALSLGQYGVHKEYDEDGKEVVLTYLDKDGNPIVTNKGYTTVSKTYHADNSMASERYYDLNGNPFSLKEGQYGVKKDNNQVTYLDKEGKETINIKRLLYNQPLYIIMVALIIVIITSSVDIKIAYLFLFIYICIICYMTLMFRDNEGAKTPELLWHYRQIIADNEARSDILKNIWLFIPLGAILWKIRSKSIILLAPFLISVVIEGIQYIAGTGFCELDDIISNSIGGWIGFHIVQLTTSIIQRIKSWRHIHTV